VSGVLIITTLMLTLSMIYIRAVPVVLAAAFALIWLFIDSLFFVRRGYLAVADHRRALA